MAAKEEEPAETIADDDIFAAATQSTETEQDQKKLADRIKAIVQERVRLIEEQVSSKTDDTSKAKPRPTSAKKRSGAWYSFKRFLGFPVHIKGRTLEYRLSALKTKFESLSLATDGQALVLGKEIEARFSEPVNSWQQTYDIEQMLIGLYTGSTLWIELKRCLALAKEEEIRLLPYFEAEVISLETKRLEAETASADDILDDDLDETAEAAVMTSIENDTRALLSAMTSELHWSYTLDFTNTGYTRATTRRVSIIFLLSLLLFASTLWVVVKKLQIEDTPKNGVQIEEVLQEVAEEDVANDQAPETGEQS